MPITKKRVFFSHRVVVLALVLFTFFMGMLVANRVFERLPHLEDEMAYLFQARTLAGGNLVIKTPDLRRVFWQPFVVDYSQTGNRFGKYSLGWPAVLSLGVIAGEPWFVNAFFGALSVATVYQLGRSVFNRDVGLIAAALTAFSPMTLLLNGTIMGHSLALFGCTLFMLAYWCITKRRQPIRWGIVAGLSLGIVLIDRPLTAVALAIPFVGWSLVRLIVALRADRSTPVMVLASEPTLEATFTSDGPVDSKPRGFPTTWMTFKPLLIIAVLTIALAIIIPIYNYAATHNPKQDLYTLVWSYDTVGFGGCCGRAVTRGEVGHVISKGILQARFDLSLTAADLFGWQIGQPQPAFVSLQNGQLDTAWQQWTGFTPDVIKHLINDSDYYPRLGLSFILLPFGILLAFRKNFWWILIWFALGYAWIYWPLHDPKLAGDPTYSYLWLGVAMLWVVVPLIWMGLLRMPTTLIWTWLFVGVMIALVGLHTAYWIGSQRYTTRYYYEALTSAAIVTAIPLAWLVQHVSRRLVYALLTFLLVYSLYAYSTPRVSALYHYNNIYGSTLDELQARRDGRPVLALVSGSNVAWRAYGALMAQTSPYLNSDIVAAWDFGTGDIRDQILAAFPDRQVITITGNGNNITFDGDN